MKKLLIGILLAVPLTGASAYAAPADEWVENYSDEEAQEWYDFSTGGNQATSGDSSDADQNAQSNTRQSGPVFVEESESNDTSEVGGSSILPIVGNDILNNADVANNLLNNYSQHDSSSRPITQTRSEDNDQTSVIEDSFNSGRVPVVVLEPRSSRVVRTTEAGGRLPTTGSNFLSPLALGIWLVTAGAWLVRRGGGRVFSLGLSS